LKLGYLVQSGSTYYRIIFAAVGIYTVLVFASDQQFMITKDAFSATANTTKTEAAPTRLSGPIVSLQFSNDGSPLWIVSGRWWIDVNFDISREIPLSTKSLNVSLTVVSIDGSSSHRYKLSDFEQSNISYDNETKTSTLTGMLKIISEGQSTNNVGATLKIVNKEVLIISLDTSPTKGYFGDTPIYGIER
jgi:hypothetical protein